MEFYANIVGNIGVACFLAAYFLLQKGKLTATGAWYLGLNLGGAVCLMLSLLVNWNLPAFLLEAAWASISIYGIIKHLYLPRRNTGK